MRNAEEPRSGGEPRPLAGTNVLAVGLRWDAVAAAVRLLAEAGSDVAAFGIGAGAWFDDEVLPEEVREQVEAPLAAGSGRLEVIELLDGAQLADLLADDGVAAVWEHATALLGDIHVAVLGNWHGWTSYELIPGILEKLGHRPVGGELIIQQSATPDLTARWAHHWAAATSIPLTVIDPAADPTAVPAGRVAAFLTAAGWGGQTDLAELDRRAEQRRRSGVDLLAGRLWRYVTTGIADRMRCGIGDATKPLDPALRHVWEEIHDRPVDLQDRGLPYVSFPFPVGCEASFGVEATPIDGDVDAVRLSWDDDAFAGKETYAPFTELDLSPPGLLSISDPWYLLDGRHDITIPVRPGRWAVELVGGDRTAGLRLRVLE